jgi:hypothetical protein
MQRCEPDRTTLPSRFKKARIHFTIAGTDPSPSSESAGLAAKRFRRTYSSSFVDLDDDGDLHLLVVSDFAGAGLRPNPFRPRTKQTFRDDSSF